MVRSPVSAVRREPHLRADPVQPPGQTPRAAAGLALLERDPPAPTVDLHAPRWRCQPADRDAATL